MSPKHPGAALPPLVIVGAGRAGTTLALALTDAGAPAVTLVCRSPVRRASLETVFAADNVRVVGALDAVSASLPLVCIATADRDIATAARALVACVAARGEGAGSPEPRPSVAQGATQVWLHLSGVAPVASLRVANPPHGAAAPHLAGSCTPPALGSCHPLAAIPDPLALLGPFDATWRRRATRPLRGAFFAVDGDPAAAALAAQLARAVGGAPSQVPAAGRAAYHAAASVVANDLVALLAIGEALCADAGVPSLAARPALLHLADTALSAVRGSSLATGATLADGLTGAVGRGDAETLSAHLAALAARPAHAATHRALSLELLRMVVEAGKLDARAAAAVRAALTPGALPSG